uniref:NADP-dependent oxidoreductase domain-containing protein n=1 Tax=Araucaria cunninghamii TaxID=56994 RepID=A0A0D6QYU3_ARACU
MEYRNLGNTGLKVSRLSYGAWVSFGNQVGLQEAKSLLTCCRDHGVNFFDNAEVYADGKAEEIMGQAIRELGWKRSDVVISTKIYNGGNGPNDMGLSRKHLVEGTRASLRRLQMEYVDVLFCHRPDEGTPVEETVRAMNFVIEQGWALYWGTSMWPKERIVEAWSVAKRLGMIGPQVEQARYHLLDRNKVEVELVPLYKEYGLGLTIYSPLASGLLSGKYSKDNIPADSRFALNNYQHIKNGSLVDEKLQKIDELKSIATDLGVSLAQLAIAWCAANPNVSTVLTGATKESQIKENMKALEVIPLLTAEVMDKIEAVMENKQLE